MPIEIRELVIKTRISDEEQNTGSSASPGNQMPDHELINECVARVMDLMKQQTER
ncbi:MAG: hypothetical protein Roseis2KO_44450 [Roseivirga sp.]